MESGEGGSCVGDVKYGKAVATIIVFPAAISKIVT